MTPNMVYWVSCCTHHEWPPLSVAQNKTAFLLLQTVIEKKKETRHTTKLKHQWQKLNVTQVCESLLLASPLHLDAMTHFHKLSSHVWNISNTTFKATFMLCSKYQLDTLNATPFFNWQWLLCFSCNAWEGQETLKKKKKPKVHCNSF